MDSFPAATEGRHARSRPRSESAPLLEFDEVYRRHRSDVYRYCLAQLADPTSAEDAAASTFTKAFRAYQRVRPDPETVRLWLVRIAANVVKDERRRQRRARRLLIALLGGSRPPADPEALALLDVELRQVLSALGRLSERERQLVALRVGMGLPFAEVAAAVGMNENSARVATQRALQRARALARGAG